MFLLFRKEFYEPIRSGRKRQTIRFWARPYVSAGRRMRCPHLGHFLITAVDEINPDDLTEDDARLDGFDSLDELRRKLIELYGSVHPPDRRCFRLAFDFLGDNPQ